MAVLAAAWTILWTAYQWSPSGVSWHYFRLGSRLLAGGSGLDLYAQHPELQIGPLAFAAVAPLLTSLPDRVALAICQLASAAVGPLLVWWLAPLITGSRRKLRLLLAILVLTPAWTALAVRWAHVDDVLALTFMVLALRATRSARPVLSGLGLAAAMAAKPWAAGFLPVLLGLDRRRLAVAAITVASGVAAVWGPFLLWNRGTLAGFHPPVAVTVTSPLRALGYRGAIIPDWDRGLQLGLEVVAGMLAGLRRRWWGVPLVAIAVRLALDPQANGYYAGGAVLAALVVDLAGSVWTVPWTALVTAIVLWQPFVADFSHRLDQTSGLAHWWFANPDLVGDIYLAWSLGAAALVLAMPAWFFTRAVTPGRRSDG